MRIGLFTDSYLPRLDGISLSVEAYRAGLESLGHDVYIFCPERPEPYTGIVERVYRFPSFPSIWYENYRDTFPFLPKHIAYIRSLNLDIVHTFTPGQIGHLGMYASFQNHIPLVTTCNLDFDLVKEYGRMILASFPLIAETSIISNRFISRDEIMILFKSNVTHDDWSHRLVKAVACFYFNQCALVTVQSEKMKKEIEPYMKKPVIVVPAGTDMKLVPQKTDRVTVRSRYGLPQQSTLFVSSSRLVKEKRIDFLIHAYAGLSSQDKGRSALVIAGDGPLKQGLENLVMDLGLKANVFFVGLVPHDQIFDVISACDIYVHASLRETQGLVLNEAAACGKPLIMIDREANPVLQESKNGLYSENNLNDYTSKMELLLHDDQLRVSFGKESSKLAKNTSQEAVSKQIEHLYKNLLD